MSLTRGEEGGLASLAAHVDPEREVDGASTEASRGEAAASDSMFRKFALIKPPEPDTSAVDASNGGDVLNSVARSVISLLREFPDLRVSRNQLFSLLLRAQIPLQAVRFAL
jgi:hypothetical protein